MGHSRNSATRIKAALRMQPILELRAGGMKVPDIADKLRIPVGKVYKLIDREFTRFKKLKFETTEQVVRLELERLRIAHEKIWAKVKQGDDRAIHTMLSLMERRARLLGLDIERHEVKIDETLQVNVSAKIDEFVAELDRQLGPRQSPVSGYLENHGSGQSVDQAESDSQAESLSDLRGEGGTVRRGSRRRKK
jgi:hypothetical protein